MKIEFDSEKHAYLIDGDIAGTSVTAILRHQGIAPDYGCVDKAVLEASAERGTEIHADLANVLNKSKYRPTTKEGRNFKRWVKNNLSSGVGEQVLGYDYKGMLIGGSADVFAIMNDGSLLVADHKTTTNLNREYVQWQINIYDYILRKLSGQEINGHVINWAGATKFLCFHFIKDSRLRVQNLEKIDDEEIERLLDAELNGDNYKQPLLVIDQALCEKIEKAELALVAIEEHKKQAEAVCKEFRAEIKKLFEAQGIKSWESADKRIKVSYVHSVTKTRVDNAKLRAQFPSVYDAVKTESEQQPSIRITVRKEREDV